MKKIYTTGNLFFILFTLHTHAGEKTYGNVTVDSVLSIYDGGTFTVTIKGWPAIIGDRISIRIY